MALTRREILAASAGWVAVTLNVLPGLGAGYLYQRRWKAYWITSALATTWFVLGGVLGQGAEAAEEIQNQLIGLLGLVALAAGTAVEAGLAAKKSRQQNRDGLRPKHAASDQIDFRFPGLLSWVSMASATPALGGAWSDR